MFFCSSTKFEILKPWTHILWPRRFDWRIWQSSKQIFRKLQYREKDFEEFQVFSRFPRKMVVYSSTKFGIRKPWKKLVSLRRLNLGFWQTSKQIYGELQFRKRTLEELQGFSDIPRWIVQYLSNKFGVLKTWTNILSLTRFDWGFLQTSKGNSNIRRKLLHSFELCLSFPEKRFCIRRANFVL